MANTPHFAPTIITAHNNADFDALAAIVAASKLYPGAVLVFPGSQERTLRNFYIQSATYLFNFRNAKDIDQASVERLILVDTRQRSRLGHIHQVLNNPGLVIHAYDHHPDSDEDLPYSQGIVKDWGSTTAILVREIMSMDITLTVDEATIMGLGIYEDTGSFTFNSTTQYDLEAAAWLRGQGMELNVIADLLNRELTAEQISVLNSLIESAQTHDINGVQVVIAEASMEDYMGDFALLAHKLLDMENIRVLFALGRMQDRIHVVGRSRSPEVDVGQICSSLGGGGHTYAASASVKDRTLSQVKDELFALLYSHINPQILVRDLMSHPAVTIDADKSLDEALELMNRYNLKALPVVGGEREACAGLLEYQIAQKGHSHGLGALAVSEYMQRDCPLINPQSDLYPVMEYIVGQGQPLVPVVEDGHVVGVITRGDLIRILIEEPARIPESLMPEKSRERNIRSLLKERLSQKLFGILELAGQLAEEMGCQIYAVGGFIRDLLLHRPNDDLDLVVEGDGIAFARALATRLRGRVRAHGKFKTAVVLFGQEGANERIDVATARLEYYQYPAALPMVQLSSIKMDLARRDFTVNALAVQLNPGQMGRLVDFFSAQRDIKEKVIRVLHSLSFVEDPTRILRAIRFEQRFGFRIGAQTERLIKNAMQLKLFNKLSGRRLLNELKHILEEADPLACLNRMQQFGLTKAIHPVLELNKEKSTVIEEMGRVLNWYRLLYKAPAPRVWTLMFLALILGSGDGEARSLLARLGFNKREESDLLQLRTSHHQTVERMLRWIKSEGRLSELCDILRHLPLEGLLYLMARSRNEVVKKSISLYLTQLKDMELLISGDDVLRLGVESGPRVGEVLRKVMAERLDGALGTREEQLAYARRVAAGVAQL